MSLEGVDILELIDRYNYLLKEYIELAPKLAKSLENFGKMRQEIQLITVEIKNRGTNVEDSEELEKLFNKKIEDLNINDPKPIDRG